MRGCYAIYRRDTHRSVVLYIGLLKEVDGYKYLGLAFGAKRLDTGRMCEVDVTKVVRTISLSYPDGATAEGSRQ